MDINTKFANSLILWYKENARILPWRSTNDPYKIWLSEIILQQTRVDQGLAYYNKFVDRYPTVDKLASADDEDVLRLWQGLGYYSRARNLHATAKLILEKYNCKFPNTYQKLLHLKGVGHYTAAAVASFAFNEKVAVLDGNVYRVLSRFYGVSSDISSSAGAKYFREISEKNLPHKDVQTYNQAIMEFGALQCVPKRPECDKCPLKNDCFALKNHMVAELPVKTKKVKIKKRWFNYLVYIHNNEIVVNKRLKKDIWTELYDFPVFESQEPFEGDVLEQLDISTNSIQEIRIINQKDKHILSHQHLYLSFYCIFLNNKESVSLTATQKWLNVKELHDIPKPIVISNFLDTHIF